MRELEAKVVTYEYEGFLQPWYFNWLLWWRAQMHLWTCVHFGAWGLFVGNDDGILMEQCLQTGIGGITPVYFV